MQQTQSLNGSNPRAVQPEMSGSREERRLIQQGADAEFARLAPRIQKLKEAVAEREQAIGSMTKELRALRAQVARYDGTLAHLEGSARADAELIVKLRREAAHDAQQLQDWMRWAWVGQPESDNADHAVYQAKIATLQNAVGYWERRARNECPANTQAVADRDAAVDFSCRHLRLADILRLMGSM